MMGINLLHIFLIDMEIFLVNWFNQNKYLIKIKTNQSNKQNKLKINKKVSKRSKNNLLKRIKLKNNS